MSRKAAVKNKNNKIIKLKKFLKKAKLFLEEIYLNNVKQKENRF